jgi:hypothetical protein
VAIVDNALWMLIVIVLILHMVTVTLCNIPVKNVEMIRQDYRFILVTVVIAEIILVGIVLIRREDYMKDIVRLHVTFVVNAIIMKIV